MFLALTTLTSAPPAHLEAVASGQAIHSRWSAVVEEHAYSTEHAYARTRTRVRPCTGKSEAKHGVSSPEATCVAVGLAVARSRDENLPAHDQCAGYVRFSMYHTQHMLSINQCKLGLRNARKVLRINKLATTNVIRYPDRYTQHALRRGCK